MTNKIVAEIQRLINCPKLFKSEDIETRISVLEYLLTYIDSLQKEPTSEELEKAANEWNAKASFTPFYMALDANGKPNGVRQSYTTHAESFKAGANWQKLQDMGITNKRAQDVVANVLSSADNPLDAYATEVAFIMLPATLKESYHQTNRDRIGDAVRLGAKWQKENDDEEKVLTYKHGFEDCKEQMMANAIDAEIVNTDTHLKLYTNLDTSKETQSKNCGRCKVIIIKEE